MTSALSDAQPEEKTEMPPIKLPSLVVSQLMCLRASLIAKRRRRRELKKGTKKVAR